MAEEVAQEESQKPKAGGKGLIIALIALVVILFIAMGVGGYFLYSTISKVQSGATTEQTEVKEEPVGKEFKASINELVLNISSAKGRVQLMKLSLSFSSSDKTIESIMDTYKDEIVDVIIAQVSARNSEELLTVGGKELLREELLSEINRAISRASARAGKPIDNPINRIYFTEFVFR
ncbi:flagellar basal body-associated FliL family protein [Arcobacter sp. FWKO B]|uniref:flagellar basal body-associated FliL family protein n=1 Tax=Arcobacter sp. FWKO B TaxID=2593672 RepID=UPI0018A63559|nr:flagellar basal body-associated FliL family protein [Arcobacter sp. FWKO B]QOG12387.1 flagellar basal body protein FliL [Arcobacter sp. FWKO B]